MVAESFILNAYATIVSWTYVLITILIIYKIISFFSGVKPGGLMSGRNKGDENEYDKNVRKRDEKDYDKNVRTNVPKRRTLNKPSRVLVFQGIHLGDRVHLSWAKNPEEEKINYYWIERRRHARTPKGFKWNRNLWGNWRRVAYVAHNYSPEAPFVDHESFKNHEGIIKEWWNSLDPIVPENDYEYRIRAVNSYGKGDWVKIRVSRPLDIDIWAPVIDDMACDDEGNTNVEGHVELRRL